MQTCEEQPGFQESLSPTPADGADSSRRERFSLTLCLLSLALLCFIAGSAAAEFRWPAYNKLLAPPFAGVRAWLQRWSMKAATAEPILWPESEFDDRGVVIHDREQAFEGLTLYASAHAPAAHLIDMEGNILHQWTRSFRDVWKHADHTASLVPDDFIYWRRCALYPNGDLLVIFVGIGDTPWGYGLVKLDSQSNILWKYTANVHHDLEVQSDGNIVTLTHGFRPLKEVPYFGKKLIGGQVLDDQIVTLSSDGQELGKVSVIEAFANSPFRSVLFDTEETEWDPLHVNSVAVVNESFALQHPFARPGQVLISIRSRNLLALVDREQEQVTWAIHGPFVRQHDARMLPNGNLSVFDNRGNVGAGGPSRILEWDPETLAIVWSFAGSQEDWFYSRTRGMQFPLPNENVLITETDRGRILEVTRSGEVVWEFRNPIEREGHTPVICGACRYDKNQLNFPFRGEINPQQKNSR